jgi:hypothetical protein
MNKFKNYFFLTAVVAYGILFYDQGQGINYLIFSGLLIILLLLAFPGAWRRSAWCYVAGASLLSGFTLVWHHSTLAYIAHLLSLALLSGLTIQPAASFFGALLHFFSSTFSSPLIQFSETINMEDKQKSSKQPGRRWALGRKMGYVIPVLITALFFVLYQNGNPVFASVVATIDFSFISWNWIVFTFAGLLLLTGTFYPFIHDFFNFEQNIPDQLVRIRVKKSKTLNILTGLKREFQTGKLLFILLNLLILFVNSLDFVYLFLLKTLPAGVNYKDFLHQSVHSLIWSIVLAIAVILYYFRGDLNFFSKNKSLKTLAYVWIFQNTLMVLITLYKNFTYISEGGLTHRRIGVYVYLLLTFIGLLVTFWKVLEAKSNWFLFKTNAWLFFIVLICSTFFNWDRIIIDYNNQSRFKSSEFDWLKGYAVYELSDSVLPELTQMVISSPGSLTKEELDEVFRRKQQFLIRQLNAKSLSWNYEDARIAREIIQ